MGVQELKLKVQVSTTYYLYTNGVNSNSKVRTLLVIQVSVDDSCSVILYYIYNNDVTMTSYESGHRHYYYALS